MRKILFVVVLLAVVLGVGFASAKLRNTPQQFIPHTIVYRQTEYDEDERVASSAVVVRRVSADGTWRHTIIRTDGSVFHSNGKLAGAITTRQTDSESPRHLGFSYYEDNQRNPSWISSDLQDFLMFTALRDNGNKLVKLEALDITLP